MEEKGLENFLKERNAVEYLWASFSQVVDWQMNPFHPMTTCKLTSQELLKLMIVHTWHGLLSNLEEAPNRSMMSTTTNVLLRKSSRHSTERY
jgi:hypothetical protein